jgi:predicted nuclease with TOPRIM domain
METKKQRGGKRAGSGRKGSGGPTTVIRVRTDLLPLIEKLKAGLSPDTTETVAPRLLELQRKYDIEHQKNLELTAKLHSMKSKIASVDKLKAELEESEKVAHSRLGEINKLRDKVARLERSLKGVTKSG